MISDGDLGRPSRQRDGAEETAALLAVGDGPPRGGMQRLKRDAARIERSER
jgi:hypothetical protein